MRTWPAHMEPMFSDPQRRLSEMKFQTAAFAKGWSKLPPEMKQEIIRQLVKDLALLGEQYWLWIYFGPDGLPYAHCRSHDDTDYASVKHETLRRMVSFLKQHHDAAPVLSVELEKLSDVYEKERDAIRAKLDAYRQAHRDLNTYQDEKIVCDLENAEGTVIWLAELADEVGIDH